MSTGNQMMPETRGMRRLNWVINNRRRQRPRRVSEELIDRAAELRESGEPAAAAALLENDEQLGSDVSALICLAGCKAAMDEPDAALDLLDDVDDVLLRKHWVVAVNRANFLKTAGRFPEAEAAAAEAIRLMPDQPLGYLVAIAVSECAGGDPGFARRSVARMDEDAPQWREDDTIWFDLISDSDYLRFRRDPSVFRDTFGEHLDDLQVRLGPAVRQLYEPTN